MANLLVAIQDQNLIASGINKSQHALASPLWIDGQNVLFEDGTVRKARGYSKAFSSGTDGVSITGVVAVDVKGTPNILFGDATKLYRFDGTVLTTEGSSYSGTTNHPAFQDGALDSWQDNSVQVTLANNDVIWSMDNFGTWAIATNGVDHIQIDKMQGAGAVALGGTPPTTAEIVVRFENFILLFNLSGSWSDGSVLDSMSFAWCDIDNPENWTSGAANFLFIRDLGSDIITACRMGNYVAVYSEDSMALVSFLDAPLWFGAKKVIEGIGATSKHGVVGVGQYNYGICKKGVWKTDGTSYKYVSNPALRRWIEDNVNFAGYGHKIAGIYNEDRSLVEFGVPTYAGGGENNATICINIDNDMAWTFRDYGITSGYEKGIWLFPIFGKSDGTVNFGEIGVDAAGSAVNAFVQSKPLLTQKDSFGIGYASSGMKYNSGVLQWKSIESIIAAFKGLAGSGVVCYVGTQASLLDTIKWHSFPVDATAVSEFASFDAAKIIDGIYISFKVQSTLVGDDWTFAGVNIYGSYTGEDS